MSTAVEVTDPTRVHLDTAINVGIRGRNAGLRPGASGAGPGNTAGTEAGAPVVVVSRYAHPTRKIAFALDFILLVDFSKSELVP